MRPSMVHTLPGFTVFKNGCSRARPTCRIYRPHSLSVVCKNSHAGRGRRPGPLVWKGPSTAPGAGRGACVCVFVVRQTVASVITRPARAPVNVEKQASHAIGSWPFAEATRQGVLPGHSGHFHGKATEADAVVADSGTRTGLSLPREGLKSV